MRSSHSPTIRSRYDYYYSSMSPASSAANFYDNQNQSLFGDPVPPSTDFLETLDNHLYGTLRRSSSVYSNSNNISNASNINNNAVSNGNGMGGFVDSPFPMAQPMAQPMGQPMGQPMAVGLGGGNRNMRATSSRIDNYPLQHPMVADPFRDSGFYYGVNRRASSSFSEEFRSNLDDCR